MTMNQQNLHREELVHYKITCGINHIIIERK